MKKLFTILLAIALLASPVWAARAIIECKVNWTGASQLSDGTWNGAKVEFPELIDGDTTGMNLDGWVDLEKVEKTKASTAEIYIRVSDAMLRAIDTDKDIVIKTLIDADAIALEKDLPTFSATLPVTK